MYELHIGSIFHINKVFAANQQGLSSAGVSFCDTRYACNRPRITCSKRSLSSGFMKQKRIYL